MSLPDQFAAFGAPHILVVGDLMLDRYVWGNAERISPEGPVLVLQADEEEIRLGGAAGVAGLLRALGVRVSLCGVVGNDSAGRWIQRLLADERIDFQGLVIDRERPTTQKERLIGRTVSRHPHQILRVDREVRTPIGAGAMRHLARWALRYMKDDCRALLISDYEKGVCSPRLVGWLIRAAQKRSIPVLVDPARIDDFAARYAGADVLVPNRLEAERAAEMRITSPADAMIAGERLLSLCGNQAVVVKLDREGMVLVSSEGNGKLFPARPREVYDVTGAGDVVLAMLGLCAAGELELPDAVELANVAAGLEVEKFGVVPINRAEILAELGRGMWREGQKRVSLDEAVALAERARRDGRTVVFTNGCFDLLHVGHVTYLQEAARLGDLLLVAVNSDASVRRLKGGGRPVIGERDRLAMLSALGCVDHVLVFDDDTPRELLRRIQPDVLVKGGDYTAEEVVGREIVTAYGGRVCVLGQVAGVSTTGILQQVADRTGNNGIRQAGPSPE